MKAVMALIAALSCSACAFFDAHDRSVGTKFKILGPDRFEYYADVLVQDGEDAKTAPVGREHWLKDWLAQNGMCGNGYRIDDVSAVRASGRLYLATYTGRCV